jgi:hypothetical protein
MLLVVADNPVGSGGGIDIVVALEKIPDETSGMGLEFTAHTLKEYCVLLVRVFMYQLVPLTKF